MMHLQVTHETRYAYTPAVETAQHMAHLKPRNTATQQLLSHAVHITPEPAQHTEAQDIYGNTRTFFSLQAAHDELVVRAQSVVATAEPTAPKSEMPWEQVREMFRYHAGGAFDAAGEFVFASPYVPRHADFTAYARPSFGAATPLLLAAQDLMQRIHTDVRYESQSTDISTPAVQALGQRKGVCQDFAHIMVACLRAMGVPARYVSGYLLTEPPPGKPRLIGSDASHAWVSVYLPDLPEGPGWCDLDPTNNRHPGADYVTLATGRDFADVSPLRGVIHGGAHHDLHVAVTVLPLPKPPAPDVPPTI